MSFTKHCFQELKEGFESEAATSGKPRLLLTAAVPAGKATIDAGYEIATISRYTTALLFDQNSH